MVASVVVLPLPVGPVTTIMPCGSVSSRVSIASSSRRQAELADLQQAAVARQQADHGGFAVLRRHGGDAHVEFGARDAHARRAVLRQAAFGDVEAGEDLDARDQRLRQDAGRRRHGAQQAVDAHAHHEPGAERLDVDVAGAQLDRALEQIVDRAHHRRAAGEIAQAFDVVVAQLLDVVRLAARLGVVTAEALVEHGRHILERGDLDLDGPEHDFRRAHRRRVGRVGERQRDHLSAPWYGNTSVSRRKRCEKDATSGVADSISCSATRS